MPPTEYMIVSKFPIIANRDIKTARRSSDSAGNPAVGFVLTPDAAQIFGSATEQNIGRRLAIVLDDVISSAPVINERIESEGIIHGKFTVGEAEDLALLLRAGNLPVSLRVLETKKIGEPKSSPASL